MTAISTATDQAPPEWTERGYFVVRGFWDPARVQPLLDAAVELARTRDPGRPDTIVELPEGRPRADAVGDEELLAKLFRLHDRQPFEEFAFDPGALAHVSSVLGPDVDVFLSQFIFKWPEAYGQPWHQDSFYFPFQPDRQVGLWLAVTKATIANGCLWVLPGSHREPVHAHVADRRPNATAAYVEIVDHDMSGAVPVEMAPGDLLVFDSHLMHMSTDNETDDLRAAFVVHYASAGTDVLIPEANIVNLWMPAQRDGRPVAPTSATGRHPSA